MKRLLAVLAVGVGLAAAARAAEQKKSAPPRQEAPKLECPDGRTPLLTGHPFRPLACPPGGKEPSRPDLALSTATAKPAAKGGASLKDLDGTWKGMAIFAGQRYDCTLEVSGGGTRAVWTAMDYATHLGHPLEADLKKPGWFSRGMPSVTVTMPHLPGARLSGKAWLAPGAAAWKFDGRPEAHRVDYSLAGGHLSAVYTDYDPVHGALATSVELDKIQP